MRRSGNPRALLLVCVILATLGATACDEKLSDITGPSPNLNPTFSSIRDEILFTTDLAGRTACGNCHNNVGGRVPAGLLNMNTDPYNALVGVQSRFHPGATLVIPGNPDDSYLIRKLEGRDITGVRMPFTGPPYLTPGQILVIRRWIEIGAPNN
jgi:hypothetical protein